VGFFVIVYFYLFGCENGGFVTYVCGALGSKFLCFVALCFCLYLFILVVIFVPLLVFCIIEGKSYTCFSRLVLKWDFIGWAKN
jgi:hypothetical protein